MKYLFLTDGASYFPSLMKDTEQGGLYNWYKCMGGEVRLWSDLKMRTHELLNYDLIHINLAASDIGLAAKVEPFLRETSVKMIVNMDYSVTYLDKHTNLRDFINDLNACDYAFGVEPGQVNLMQYMMSITKKGKTHKIALMPHPIDLVGLEKQWIPYKNRFKILAYQYHKYDAHWEIPRLLMLNLPDNVLAACLGYAQDTFNTADMADIVMPYTEWGKYLYFLSRCLYGFEYRTHKAASRFVMEAGALGIPVVTTDDSYMGGIVFPEICHPSVDFHAIRESIEKIITNMDFRIDLVKKGMDKLEHFNYENSKKAMERFVT